jgi:hypothetical protein
MATLSPVFWGASGLVLLFAAFVALRFALSLAREARSLAGQVRRANERLRDAVADLEAEVRAASLQVEELRPTRRRQGSG